ncbi:MAG: PIN domain-containing protein [Planctomycetota bacterium]|jgi:hypothetical protein
MKSRDQREKEKSRAAEQQFEIFIISVLSEDDQQEQKIFAIKRALSIAESVTLISFDRSDLSFSYHVSIKTSLSSDQLLQLLIKMKDDKLINYAEIDTRGKL